MFQEELEPDRDALKTIATSNSGVLVIAVLIWSTIKKMGIIDPSNDAISKLLSGGKFLPMLFGLSAVVVDIWTNYPRVWNWILVILSGSVLAAVIYKQFPKMAVIVALQIWVVFYFINVTVLFDILRLLIVLPIGYTYLSLLIRAWEVHPTTILGKLLIGTILALDLVYMNINSKAFLVSIIDGSVLWTLLYYAILYCVGLINMLICFWMHPQKANWSKVGTAALLRLMALMFVYVFYNPTVPTVVSN